MFTEVHDAFWRQNARRARSGGRNQDPDPGAVASALTAEAVEVRVIVVLELDTASAGLVAFEARDLVASPGSVGSDAATDGRLAA